jgi:hypothetical protein
MTDAWYEVVEASARLTQGDFIFDCPISTWAEEAKEDGAPAETPASSPLPEILWKRREIIAEDVIVMTQACDLEHGKVTDVVLCPHYALSYFRDQIWKPDQQAKGQNTKPEVWQKYFKAMANGHLWNLCVLNSSAIEGYAMEHRVVDFHAIYTVPRDFLGTLLADRKKPRVRLLPPYREHLSQAFARYFMRVGLPAPLASPGEAH